MDWWVGLECCLDMPGLKAAGYWARELAGSCQGWKLTVCRTGELSGCRQGLKAAGWALPGRQQPENWWGQAWFKWWGNELSGRRTLSISNMKLCGSYVVPSTKKEDQTKYSITPLTSLSCTSLHLPCNTQTHCLAEPSMTKTITNTTHTDFLAPRKSAMGPTWCGLSTGEAISPGWCLSFLDSTSTSTIGYKVSYNAKN